MHWVSSYLCFIIAQVVFDQFFVAVLVSKLLFIEMTVNMHEWKDFGDLSSRAIEVKQLVFMSIKHHITTQYRYILLLCFGGTRMARNFVFTHSTINMQP